MSYYLRRVGEQQEQMVYVRHSHYLQAAGKSSDFTRSTGVKVLSKCFDTLTGKVSTKLPIHVEYNEIIQQVYADIAKASRDVCGYDLEPTKERVQTRYEEIIASRVSVESNLPILKAGVSNHLTLLRQELAELKALVAAKEEEIAEWELINGDFDKTLLTHFLRKYAGTLPRKEGVRNVVGEKNLRDATIAVYNTLIQIITDYNPRWRLADVNNVTLKAFENYLLDKRNKENTSNYRNSTIITYLRKIKAVAKHFADTHDVDLTNLLKYKSGISDLDDRSIVMLTREELDALEVMDLPTASQQRVRDLFVVMAKTSLRYSDLWLTRANVKGNFLEVRTKKKGKIARIPICKAVRIILERYDYTIKPMFQSYFNKTIKSIGERLSQTVVSLGYDEQVAHKNRVTTDTVGKPKYALLSAHVARKTFVSLALASKVNPASVKGFTTHSKMDTLLNHYGNTQVNSIEEMNKVFEM